MLTQRVKFYWGMLLVSIGVFGIAVSAAAACQYPVPTKDFPTGNTGYNVAISSVGMPKYEYQPEEPIHPSAVPISTGSSAAPKTRLGYFYSPCNNPSQLVPIDGDDVDAGKYGREELIKNDDKLAPSTPGRYVLTVCADYDENRSSRLTETDESDNCKSVEFVVAGAKFVKKFSSSDKSSKHRKAKHKNKGKKCGKKKGCDKNSLKPAKVKNTKKAKKSKKSGDPINLVDGAQEIDLTLLEVEGILPLAIDLRYNSLLLEDGKFGTGWDMDGVTARLQVIDDNKISVFWSANAQNDFIKDATGIYRGDVPETYFDTLVKNADGSFTLTLLDEEVIYQFSANGVLAGYSDLEGHAIVLEYSGDNLTRMVEPVSGVFISLAYNSDNLVESVSDSLNRRVTLHYDSDYRLIAIVDAAGQRFDLTYNEFGQATRYSSGDTVFFNNQYDAVEGWVISQDDGNPNNQPMRLAYDRSQADKLITTVTDRTGQNRVLSFNQNYQLLEVRDELTRVIYSATYNPDGTLASETDGNGNTYRFTYDGKGNPLSITDPKGRVTKLGYDEKGNLLVLENALGKQFSYGYQGHHLISETDPLGATWQHEYDGNGFRVKTISPSGAVSSREYDWTSPDGLVIRDTDAEGNVEISRHDKAGRLISVTDANNRTMTLVWDNLNRVTAILLPLNRKIEIVYDIWDNPIQITDAKGNVTRNLYDANGNLVKTLNALNQAESYVYDGEDRLSQILDASGGVTEFLRDPTGQVVGIKDPLGNVQKFTLDAEGNVLEEFDALNQKISATAYDETYNPVSVKDALGNEVTAHYDELDRLVKTINEVGTATQFTHDDLNRLQSSVDALSGISSQSFDADGLPQSLTDPNNNQTLFSHDKAGKTLAEQTADGGKVQYRYQADDLIQILNARGQVIEFEYDEAGRPVSWKTPEGEFSATYDANDNVLTNIGPSGTSAYVYNELDQITAYTDVFGNTLLLEYTATGQIKTLTYPGGKQVKYGHDLAGRLETVTDWAGRVYRYGWNANGQLASLTRPNGTVQTRSYDVAGNLTQIQDSDSAGNLITQSDLSYYPNSDIPEEILQPLPAQIFPQPLANMTYTAGNRLASYNSLPITHDADGNMTGGVLQGKAATFSFNAQNYLTEVGATRYFYAPEGHRVGVSVNGAQSRYFVNPVPALNQTLIRTLPDGTQTFYVYGLGLLAEETGNAYRAYHFDMRGSTVAQTDSNGAVTARMQYDTYGALQGIDPAQSATPFLFNGEYGVMTDANGLYYMRARYYSPTLRRFINQDVLLGEVSDGRSLNRFAYVNGNPVSLIDPFGLEGCLSEPISQVCSIGPFDAYRVKKIADDSLTNAQQSGLPELHNGQADAYRHCYWSCKMTKSIGRKQAKKVGDTHEQCGQNQKEETEMDQRNNAIGRSFGANKNNCSLACSDAAKTGKLSGRKFDRGDRIEIESFYGTTKIITVSPKL